MKRTILLPLLLGEAVLLAVLSVLPGSDPGHFSSVFAFPFEQIAGGLRALSKAGPLGNGAALALWVGIAMLPAILCCPRPSATVPERISALVLSAVLLFALYGMANPYRFCPQLLGAEAVRIVKAIFGVSVWAAAALCLVLWLIRRFRTGDKARLLNDLGRLLAVLCAVLTAAAVMPLAGGAVELAGAQMAVLGRIVSGLRLLAGAVPYLLDIAVVLQALTLLDAAKKEDPEEIPAAAGRLSRMCCLALGITAALTVAVNLLQLAAMRWLTNIAVSADIPVVSLVFVVVILLFARLLMENKQLRDDNSLFI